MVDQLSLRIPARANCAVFDVVASGKRLSQNSRSVRTHGDLGVLFSYVIGNRYLYSAQVLSSSKLQYPSSPFSTPSPVLVLASLFEYFRYGGPARRYYLR